MTQPNIPNISPTIDISTQDALNIILASIGLEELSLAHILNTEAEKVQYALGTLETAIPLPVTGLTFDQLLALNKSTNRNLLGVAQKELILLHKLSETIDLFNDLDNGFVGDCNCQATFNNITTVALTAFFRAEGEIQFTAVPGSATVNGSICPNCTIEGSGLTFTFTENPIVVPDQSFTFVATSINEPNCNESPTALTLTTFGEGTVIPEEGDPFTATFSLNATETNVGTDSFFLSLNALEPGIFQNFQMSFSVPDDDLIVEECPD
jgi:hypothetical protein